MPTGAPADELAKRAATLEDLHPAHPMLLGLAVVFLVFGLFDLWPCSPAWACCWRR